MRDQRPRIPAGALCSNRSATRRGVCAPFRHSCLSRLLHPLTHRWPLHRLAALLNPGHHIRMRAYSEDLSRKIVEAIQRGMGSIEAARSFGVSFSSVKRYVGAHRKGETLRPKKHPGSRPKIDERGRRLLECDVEERPTLSLLERCRFLEQATGMRVSESTMSRVLRRLGFSRKKGAWERVSVTNGLEQLGG